MLNQATDDAVSVQVEHIPTTRDLVNQHLVQITAGDITAIVVRAVERGDECWKVWHYVDLEFDTVVETPAQLEQIAAVVTKASDVLRSVDADLDHGGGQ
jgi:hypothetical protein